MLLKLLVFMNHQHFISPTLDKFTFPSGLSLNTATVLGEKIVGADDWCNCSNSW